MKSIFFMITISLLLTAGSKAQNASSPFRKGYTRLGIQAIGESLDNQLSPEANILSGRQGTSLGFVLEKGHIFYFIPEHSAKMFNAGLDWTILSASYNASKKAWATYVADNTGYTDEDFTAKFVATLSTKIGPVITINPAEGLIIDVRGQIGVGVYAMGPLYESVNSATEYV
ncbi:MAG: hypothetical protein QM640_01775, partial [Niabella sp.]